MIQAINSMTSVNSQPIKPASFSGRKLSAEEVYMREQTLGTNDSFTQKNTDTLEQKYDLACRIAAYYKAQYDKLTEEGNCLA